MNNHSEQERQLFELGQAVVKSGLTQPLGLMRRGSASVVSWPCEHARWAITTSTAACWKWDFVEGACVEVLHHGFPGTQDPLAVRINQTMTDGFASQRGQCRAGRSAARFGSGGQAGSSTPGVCGLS
jgi:hypothetical protein